MPNIFYILFWLLTIPNTTFNKVLKSENKHTANNCQLPPHPSNGHWSVFKSGGKYYSVGQKVSEDSTLIVDCNKNHKLKGNKNLLCIEGSWNVPMPECLNVCESLFNTESTFVTCKVNDKPLPNCHNPEEGTVAEFRCGPFLEDAQIENNPPLYCSNGKWKGTAPRCKPVCGKTYRNGPTPLIIGGRKVTNATRNNFPWVTAVYNVKSKKHICAGSLISQRLVLTAAHCVSNLNGEPNYENMYSVAVGKYFRKMNDKRDNNTAQFSLVTHIFIPNEYKGELYKYLGDIAILVTREIFNYTKTIQPVCVDWYQKLEHVLYQHSNAYVTGWGYTQENKNSSEVLKQLTVPVISHSECLKNIPDSFKAFLTTDKLCAGFLNASTSVCGGDSGGGLVYEHNEKYYIVGVVSTSPLSPTSEGGCDSQQFTFYTKISSYKNFILQQNPNFERSGFDDKNNLTTSNNKILKKLRTLCTNPPYVHHGYWVLTNSSNNYALHCDVGYNLTDKKTLHCNSNGWATKGSGQCLEVCGRKIENDNRHFPWHAGVFNFLQKLFICSGSLINKRIILTNAKCLMDQNYKHFLPLDSFVVSLGKQHSEYNSTQDKNTQQNFAINKIFRGGFDDSDDMALLRLSRDVQFSIHIQPVCIDWNMKINFNGLGLLMPGWDFVTRKEAKNGLITNQIRVVKFEDSDFNLEQGILFDGDKNLGTGNVIPCFGFGGNGVISKHSSGQYYLRFYTPKSNCFPYQYLIDINLYIKNFVYPPDALFKSTVLENTESTFCTVPRVNNGYVELRTEYGFYRVLPEQRLHLNHSLKVYCNHGYSTNRNRNLLCSIASLWKTFDCT